MTILTFGALKGQIARYMKVYRMRYAFLTTYEQTVFLKQEQLQDGEWVLWYSSPIFLEAKPIFHDTTSNLHIENPNDHRSYQDCVSLKECILYFLHMSRGETTARTPNYGQTLRRARDNSEPDRQAGHIQINSE